MFKLKKALGAIVKDAALHGRVISFSELLEEDDRKPIEPMPIYILAAQPKQREVITICG